MGGKPGRWQSMGSQSDTTEHSTPYLFLPAALFPSAWWTLSIHRTHLKPIPMSPDLAKVHSKILVSPLITTLDI